MDYKKIILDKKFIVPALLLFVLGGVSLPLYFVNAGLFEVTGATINFLVGWLIDLITTIIGGTLLPLAGFLVGEVFGAGEFIRNGLVEAGWKITRDITNMLFILILVAIGFATTLRIESYGVKRLLPKLVLVALLINFSLLIGGVFIDMGNDIGYFFTHGGISEDGSDDVNIGSAIMASLKLTKEFDIPDPDPNTSGDQGTAILTRRFMTLIFFAVATFVLFAMAFIMLFRMVHLWILLIISPLAWAAFILPSTQKMWSSWWNDFLKWAFFPAIYGFFIYLALLTTLGFTSTEIFGSFPTATPLGSEVPFSNIRFFLQYLAVIFILVYGLILANKWSLAGAGTAMKWGNKAKDWSLGKVKGGITGGAIGTAKFAGGVVKGGISEDKKAAVAKIAERTPILGRKLGGPGAREKAKTAATDKWEKDLKGRSTDDLRDTLNQRTLTQDDLHRRAAALKLLAADGKLKDGDKKHFDSYLKSGGKANDVLNYAPNWAMDENIQDALANNPATKNDWKHVADMEPGSLMRGVGADSVIDKKLIPKKPGDFAKKIKKSSINYKQKTDNLSPEEKRIEEEENKKRLKVIGIIGDQFATEKLKLAHLNSMIYTNPDAHEVLVEYLKEPGIKDRLPEHIQKHLDGNPFYGAMGPDMGSGGSSGAAGGGAGGGPTEAAKAA